MHLLTTSVVGVFYCCLGNIEPRLRSRFQSTFLLAVVKTSLVDTYGTNVILEPFVQEILQLESVRVSYPASYMYMCVCHNAHYSIQDDGVPFEVNGQTRYLRGTLATVPADNPASDLIGGHKALHFAFRKCRDCL